MSPIASADAFRAIHSTETRAVARSSSAAIPWPVWCAVGAVTLVAAGVYWDISWHMTIGRDTFWTPAHVVIYAAALVAGLSSAYLIFSTTFGGDHRAKQRGIGVFGFRGPLGSFIAAWGAGVMLTSAPFDNWWHSAYGLDVKILSPPHVVLSIGIGAIAVAALFLLASYRNNAEGELRHQVDWMLRWVGGVFLCLGSIFLLERSYPAAMHSADFYGAMTFAPAMMISVAIVSESRWPATTMAGVYTVLWLAGLWILPLFAAEPRLGPVYQRIAHMVPLGFPLLLIAPGLAIDLVRSKVAKFNSLRSTALAGCAFFAALIAVQWPFADFLMMPAARNWMFGQAYFSAGDPANFLYNPYVFKAIEATPQLFWTGMFWVPVGCVLAAWIGWAWGAALRDIKH
jgi:hypothetical protein